MSRKQAKPRIAWEDRFARPSVGELLEPFAKHQATLIEHIREELLALEGVRETIIWRGTWRWTFAYTADGDGERPWAYVVPQPGRPLVAIPLNPDAIAALPLRRLSKAVRDGIALAARVGDVAWPQWEPLGRGQADELLTVAKKKHELLLSPAG